MILSLFQMQRKLLNTPKLATKKSALEQVKAADKV